MIFIRSVIYFLFMVISVIIHGGLIALLGWLLPQSYSDWLATAWGRVNLVAMRWLCNLDVNIEGWENIPQQGAGIIMSKHQSTWETISLRGLFPIHQSWILKKELMQIPIFGWALHFTRSIPIDRSAGRKALKMVVEDGLKRLAQERLIVVFPEGTRTAPGERQKYSAGGAMLAEKSGLPVIPIADNAGVYWKRRGVKKYPGVIQVRVGKPIPTEDRKASVIMKDVEDWIEGQMETL